MNKSLCRLVSIFILLMVTLLCSACSEGKKLKVDDYNNSGIAYSSQGQYDLAINDFTKAIELGKINPTSYYNRGNAYYSKGQFDLAIKDLSKAIELHRRNENFYYNRAKVYTSNGQYDLASKDLNKAIEITVDRTTW